jgi:hypothetical protein
MPAMFMPSRAFAAGATLLLAIWRAAPNPNRLVSTVATDANIKLLRVLSIFI